MKRVATFLVAAVLIGAALAHAWHGHDAEQHASQLHATCVVCQIGSPTATAPVAVHAGTEPAPVCHLSITDRDHAIPPARVEVDLSRAPPSLLAS